MKNFISRKFIIKTGITLLVVFLLGVSNYSSAQVQNVPEGLYTEGPIQEPIEMGPDFTWTFINETGCEITLSHWMVFDNTNQHVRNGIVVPAKVGPTNGQVTILQSNYLALFGIGSGAFLTHTYFQISVGAGYQFDQSPFNSSGRVVTGQLKPCDCFIWVADFDNKTYTISKCN